MSEDSPQGDPFDDPLWKAAEKVARRGCRHEGEAFIGCPLWWFKWVLSLTRSAEQLAVALYLYRLRVVRRSKTISMSNRGLEQDLGISRFAKYRSLAKLEEAGALRIERRDGRVTKVTLLR